jgi:hypothetical protein
MVKKKNDCGQFLGWTIEKIEFSSTGLRKMNWQKELMPVYKKSNSYGKF